MKTFLLLIAFSFLNYQSQAQRTITRKDSAFKVFQCEDLQIAFTLPSAFLSLANEEMERLSQRGHQAVREEFDKEEIPGWQNGCIILRDSLKRVVTVNHISAKEAISQNGSVDQFIDKAFDDANEFLIRRVQSKAGISFKKEDVAKQTVVTIAGYHVRKDAVDIKAGNILMIMSRYYFFQKNNRLYLVSFTAGDANDNLEIEKAIESAVKM